jgi:flagellar L-ring protein precursor FlgH
MEAVRGPELAPAVYPAALVGGNVIIRPEEPITAQSSNSLWRSGARAFFKDQRASRVGDILTVQIDIDDSVQTSNSTASGRTSGTSLGFPALLGFESSISKVFPSTFDPANAIETNSDTSNAGSGSITRQEKISLTMAATVVAVMPNGNLMVQGIQEVRTNAEVRHVSVSGVVRPEDITAANTVRHSQLAELRLDYGGRGDISRVQKTPAGQSLIERFTPF